MVQNLGLLVFRVLVSLMMLAHGWGKLVGFSAKSSSFPDPIGLGSQISLAFAVLSEFFCSILIILGIFTRFATIPLIITMLVAWYLHAFSWGQGWNKQELAVLYLSCYVVIALLGPGEWSLDKVWLKRKSY